MCGLIGFSGKKELKFNPDKIKLLMLYNESRGEDSSGYWTPGEREPVKFMGKTSATLLPEVSIIPDNLFIGHTRKASYNYNAPTKTIEQAHPFEFDTFIFAHNGTLTDLWTSAKLVDKTEKELIPDSLLIGHFFNKFNDPKKVFPELSGIANVLISFKDNPNTLHVYKHPERELFRGETEEGMYISSIKASLEAIGCEKIKEFSDNYWYTITDGAVVGSPLLIKMKSETNKDRIGTSTRSVGTNEWQSFKPGAWVRCNTDFKGTQNNVYTKNTYYKLITGLTGLHDDTFRIYGYDWVSQKYFDKPNLASKDDLCYLMSDPAPTIGKKKQMFVVETTTSTAKVIELESLVRLYEFPNDEWKEKLDEILKISLVPVLDLLPFGKDEYLVASYKYDSDFIVIFINEVLDEIAVRERKEERERQNKDSEAKIDTGITMGYNENHGSNIYTNDLLDKTVEAKVSVIHKFVPGDVVVYKHARNIGKPFKYKVQLGTINCNQPSYTIKPVDIPYTNTERTSVLESMLELWEESKIITDEYTPLTPEQIIKADIDTLMEEFSKLGQSITGIGKTESLFNNKEAMIDQYNVVGNKFKRFLYRHHKIDPKFKRLEKTS